MGCSDFRFFRHVDLLLMEEFRVMNFEDGVVGQAKEAAETPDEFVDLPIVALVDEAPEILV